MDGRGYMLARYFDGWLGAARAALSRLKPRLAYGTELIPAAD